MVPSSGATNLGTTTESAHLPHVLAELFYSKDRLESTASHGSFTMQQQPRKIQQPRLE